MTTKLLEYRDLADLDRALRNARIAEYPFQSIYLFVSLIFVVSLYNVVSIAHGYFTIHRARSLELTLQGVVDDEEKQGNEQVAATLNRVSVKRVPSALLSLVRTAAYRLTIPTWFGIRLTPIEILIPLVYVLTLLTWEFAKARNIINGQLDPQYWADRAGTLAACKLTFIVALSGKNNIISLLTGISYEKLSILHRVAARTLLLLIWIHFWGRWKLVFNGSDSIINGWLRSGIAGATSLTLAVLITNRKTRKHAYELFVVSHNILIFLFLLTVYFHVRNFPQFTAYAWPPFIVWGLDRLLRLSRVIYIRRLSSQKPSGPANALVEILPTDAIRVTLRIPSSKLLSWRPGQHAFLTVPSVSRSPLEAHPFTIASLDAPDGGEVDLKLIIRARTGFTRRLYDYTVRASSEAPLSNEALECRVSAYIDGPYGSPPSVNTYPNVILIAGGSGISYTLPVLLDIARQKKDRLSVCRRVLFLWFIREQAHIRWISDDLARLAKSPSAGLDIDIRIFVTGSAPDQPPHASKGSPTPESDTVDEGEDSEKQDSLEGSIPGGTTTHPDPDLSQENAFVTVSHARRQTVGLAQLLEDEISLCANTGSVTVHVSGPTTLIDDVRRSLRKPSVSGPMTILKGGASVFLHVETFGIA
ncbi:hypothetical protein M0805_003311 [Coniferiporia weirii]|nr:hypothetical protein M0805_003311 [Coniferiporia weirii]